MDKAGDQDSTRQNSKPINEILHEFATYTTAHGLNRLVESAGILRKLIWAAFCLGAMGMFLFQSYGLIEQYFARPLSTTLTVHHQTVRNTSHIQDKKCLASTELEGAGLECTHLGL